MKRRVVVGALIASLFVVTTAGPAAATDGGLKHINFPKHDCAGARAHPRRSVCARMVLTSLPRVAAWMAGFATSAGSV